MINVKRWRRIFHGKSGFLLWHYEKGSEQAENLVKYEKCAIWLSNKHVKELKGEGWSWRNFFEERSTWLSKSQTMKEGKVAKLRMLKMRYLIIKLKTQKLIFPHNTRLLLLSIQQTLTLSCSIILCLVHVLSTDVLLKSNNVVLRRNFKR